MTNNCFGYDYEALPDCLDCKVKHSCGKMNYYVKKYRKQKEAVIKC